MLAIIISILILIDGIVYLIWRINNPEPNKLWRKLIPFAYFNYKNIFCKHKYKIICKKWGKKKN